MFCLCIISHKFGISDPKFVLDRQDGFMLLAFFGMFIFYIISVVKAKQGVLEFEKPERYKLASPEKCEEFYQALDEHGYKWDEIKLEVVKK